jgi:RNA polymerase sigma factor (sigma-70 family)
MARSQEAILIRHLHKLAAAQRQEQASDRVLLEQFLRRGDEAAFAVLVERHGSMVLGVCRSVLAHQQDAEDAFQATFLVLARKAGAIRQHDSLSSWLHGVAYRVALKARARAPRKATPLTREPQSGGANPLDELSVRQWQAILHEELNRLPDKYRTALLLCYWEGKTRDEAAQQLGCKRGTLKEQLERARNLLRGRLVRRGLLPSAAIFTALFTQNAAHAVSGALVQATARAAPAFAVKTASSKPSSATAWALAEGALRTMQITRWARMAATLALILGVSFGAGLSVLAFAGAGAQVEAAAEQEKPPAKTDSPPKIEPQAPGDAPPKVEWNGHNKGLPRGDLKIVLATGPKVQRTKSGLSLPVKITNESKETITLKLPHEWHGGEWPTTDLYASVTKAPKGEAVAEAPFRVLYQFGEQEGQAAAPVMLGPFQSAEIDVRMDWPGTGSVIGVPLMKPADSGTYQVRLLLVFELGKQQQYVVGAANTVELPAEEELPQVKDADANAWLKDNIDRFKLTLSGGIGHPSVNFALNPKVGTHPLSKAEAAAIVQTLVDTGMWGRFDQLPEMHFPARYLYLGQHAWRLGAIDDDIATRIIIQHLLKLGGEREKAIRTWLDMRPKKPDEPRPPRDSDLVRELPADPGLLKAGDKPFVIASADELMQAASDKKQAELIAKQVDFTRERLVAFAWQGSSDSKMRFEVVTENKVKVVVFHRQPGKRGDKAVNHFLFAVSRDVNFQVPDDPPWKGGEGIVRKIDLSGYRGDRPNKRFGDPLQIGNPEELAKALADKQIAEADKQLVERIAKEVDFKRERLLFFAWAGAGADSLTFTVRGDKAQSLVVFNYLPSPNLDLAYHFELYAVLRDANVVIKDQSFYEPKETKLPPADGTPPLREIDLKEAMLKVSDGDPKQPTKVNTAEWLHKMFPDDALRTQIAGQVDFAKDYLLYFRWTGSSDDKLWHKVVQSKDGPIAFFRYTAGHEDKVAAHHRLFVLPSAMTYRVAQRQTGLRDQTRKPLREISLEGFKPPRLAADPTQPQRITSLDEAAKIFPAKNWLNQLSTIVDFDEEHLLYFAWSSGGGEKLVADLESIKGVPTAVFRYHGPGNDAKAEYVRLFVTPFNADWKVESARPGAEKSK